MTVLYGLGRGLALFCFSNFGRMEVTGSENVPPYGPLIVACNHLSYSDPPLLVASIPRPLHFVGKKELFSNPIFRFIMNKFHVSPLSGSGISAVRLLIRLLDQDKAVVIFPEGRRSPDHTLQEAMQGVVYLALKSQAPILPVGLVGTEKARGWRMPVPLCRMKANIGQPFSLPVLEGQPSREVMKSLLDMVMSRVASLLPEEYRGAYASHVSLPRSGPGTPATASQTGEGQSPS